MPTCSARALASSRGTWAVQHDHQRGEWVVVSPASARVAACLVTEAKARALRDALDELDGLVSPPAPTSLRFTASPRTAEWRADQEFAALRARGILPWYTRHARFYTPTGRVLHSHISCHSFLRVAGGVHFIPHRVFAPPHLAALPDCRVCARMVETRERLHERIQTKRE